MQDAEKQAEDKLEPKELLRLLASEANRRSVTYHVCTEGA